MKKIFTSFLTILSIQLFAQPANDVPCNATNLIVDTIGYNLTCTPTTIYSWTFANPSVGASIPAVTCGAGNNVWDDVWFKFTVPSTGRVNIYTEKGNIPTDPVMEAYSASSCSGTFISKGCNDDYSGSYPALLLSDLVPGSTIYLRVWIFNAIVDGDIRICITAQPFASDSSKKVGIGTNSPQANLDVNGNAIIRGELRMETVTKGLILPRVNATQLNSINPAPPGTLAFNTSDSSLYVNRNSGWTKMSSDWGSTDTHIYNTNPDNVGIGNTNPTHARLEINGNVGAAVAMFGADKFGVTIEANNPEIGFNYFFNNVPKTIKAGKAAVLGMTPSNGDLYIGNFNDNVSATDFGSISGFQTVMTVKQNGHVGILTDPARAGFEQNGVVGNTAAIFGGEGAGISLQRNWPAVGYNHWYDGAVHRSISSGWVGQLGLSQSDGSLYFATAGDYVSVAANQDMSSVVSKFTISRKGDVWANGNIAINNANDGAALKIHNTVISTNNINTSGIRFETDANGGGSYPWNIFGSSAFYFAYNGVWKSNISASDGSYYYISDVRLKKDIHPVADQTLSKIMLLNPVNYLMKEEEGNSKKHIGFISQEVEKLYPEVVQESNGIKTMNYSGLIPILTKGIQEQQQQIETMQKDNADLKTRLEQLEKNIQHK